MSSKTTTDQRRCEHWAPVTEVDMGGSVVEELLLDWLEPFLTVEEQGRLMGWHLGASL